jgi:transposase
MPAHAVDSETKQQDQTWLLLTYSYSYSIRQIASELDVGLSTVQKWRQELVDNEHQFENARPNAIRPTPKNKLSQEETALILKRVMKKNLPATHLVILCLH